MHSLRKDPFLEDDSTEPIWPLVEHRIPWLIIGLLGGILATIFSSQFEHLLAAHLSLAYFIPVIVYMSDAVGTQTETIYVRNLSRKGVRLSTYIAKEIMLGLVLGLTFGSVLGFFALWWFHDTGTALTVGTAMFATMAIAPSIALIVPTTLQKIGIDPAIGSGPFTTVIQDLLSLTIYFIMASIIIFR